MKFAQFISEYDMKTQTAAKCQVVKPLDLY